MINHTEQDFSNHTSAFMSRHCRLKCDLHVESVGHNDGTWSKRKERHGRVRYT